MSKLIRSTVHIRRPARAATIVGVVTILAVTPATAAGAEAAATPEPTSTAFLRQTDVDPPERSRSIDSLRLRDGCGAPPEGGPVTIDGRPDDWAGAPTWIAGTGRYDNGEFLWTDYPFDDDGTGGFTYPGEGEPLTDRPDAIGQASTRQQRYGSNAADVVELRATADSRFLYVLAQFNFLNAADSTVLGLALDTDNDPASGTGEWPDGAQVRTPGADMFVTAHGTCARLSGPGGERALDAAGGVIRVDTAENVMELAIPRSQLGDAPRVRMAGAAGLWDPAADAWMVPTTDSGDVNSGDRPIGAKTAEDPAIFNLLFRDDEGMRQSGKRTFQANRQHAVLSGGTTGSYAAVLDMDRIGQPSFSTALPLRKGDHIGFTRVYRSRIDLEGVFVVPDGALKHKIFLSRYQPYGVSLPLCYEAGDCPWPGTRAPLRVVPHGGGGNHLTYTRPDEPLFPDLDAALAPVSLQPFGRGPRQPWYRGIGEADVLEAIEDVQRHYRTDPQRRLVTGGSLGGYGTTRMASLYPDLWSGAIAHCPVEFEDSALSPGAAGNIAPAIPPFTIEPIMAGLLNVPYRQTSGVLDPLAPINANHRIRDAALAADLDFRYVEYQLGAHCADLADGKGRLWPGDGNTGWVANHTPDMIALLSRPREARPARVRYAIDPRAFRAGAEWIGAFDARDLGLVHQGAYWVAGLTVRPSIETAARAFGAGESVVASIDVASHALPGWQVRASSCGESQGTTPDDGGYPDLQPPGPTPHTWLCRKQNREGALGNAVDLTARNLSTASVDLRTAGLDVTKPIELNAAGDGVLELSLPQARLDASGLCVTGTEWQPGPDSVVTLALGPQPCQIHLTPRRGA